MRLDRLEVWSDTDLSTAGARLGSIPAHHLVSASDIYDLNGDERLTFTLASSAPNSTMLDLDLVLRSVHEPAGGAGARTWHEWRIRQLQRTRDNQGRTTLGVEAWSLRHDLTYRAPLLEYRQANGDVWLHNEWVNLTSTELWDELWHHIGDTPDVPGWFGAGTVPSFGDKRYDFTLDWETPGSALAELAAVLGLELEYQRLSTGYVVNLSTARNSTMAPVLVAFRKNQAKLGYKADIGEAATRIYPRGLEVNAYKPAIGSAPVQVSTSTSTAVQWSLRVPTMEANQLSGLYLEHATQPGTIVGPIVNSWTTSPLGANWSAVAFTTTPGSTAELAAGPQAEDWTYIRLSTAGKALNYVPRASTAISGLQVRPLILDRQDIPVVTNLARDGTNPSTASGHWFVTPGVLLSYASGSTTPFVQYGTRSMRISFGAVTTTRSLLLWDEYRNTIPVSTQQPHLSWQVNLYLQSGAVAVTAFAGSSVPLTDPTVDFPSSTQPIARATGTENWHHIAIAPGAYNFMSDYMAATSSTQGPASFGVQLYNLSSGTVVYLDAWQVVNSPVPAEQFVEGCAAEKLWGAANELYRRGISAPQRSYDIDAVDFGRLDPAQYPDEELLVGRRMRLSDPGLGVAVERRIERAERDLLVEARSRVRLLQDINE